MTYMRKPYTKLIFVSVFAVLVGGLYSIGITKASHSWANYHWPRSANPVILAVGDNVSSIWDGHLDIALGDWNASTVVELSKTSGSTNPKSCKPVSGRIEVCSSKYGRNGWLGIAQIWVDGDHITQAVAKMNDTYFSRPPYNTAPWRQLVMCQEIAHDFGLDHQDENFDNPNLGTCMDYTNDPDGPPSNEHPNAHDFEELEIIYAHLDATSTTVVSPGNGKNGGGAGVDVSDVREWGKAVRKDSAGRANLFERDLGNGKKIITHVLWVESIEGN